METKLTLKLDRDVIHSVKKYAENNNRSVSKLVEDYFRHLLSDNEPESDFSPLVKELSGVITEQDLIKADYYSYLETKYE